MGDDKCSAHHPGTGFADRRGNDVVVSAAFWWGIASKARIGKNSADERELRNAAAQSGFQELPLLGVHAEMPDSLPRHHNAPFDRMLVAQTMTEPMRLITGNSILEKHTTLVMRIEHGVTAPADVFNTAVEALSEPSRHQPGKDSPESSHGPGPSAVLGRVPLLSDNGAYPS